MADKPIVDADALASLAVQLGAGGDQKETNNSKSRLPILKVNSLVEDDEGNMLPRGQYFVTGMEKEVYAPEVEFRPLAHGFQYRHYSSSEKRQVNKTLVITSFREEARDMLGTIRCGKPTSRELQNMDDASKERFKEIVCFRLIRGLVSYTGKTVDGEELKIENQPVLVMNKGSNFNDFQTEYLDVLPNGRNLFDYSAKMTTKRHKNGNVVWFTMQYEPQLKTPLKMTTDIFETMKGFAEQIRMENDTIDKAHKQALLNKSSDHQALKAIQDVEDALEADFEDVA